MKPAISAAVCAALLAGCTTLTEQDKAALSALEAQAQPAMQSPSLMKIVDLQTPAKAHTLSFWATDCQYGILEVGEGPAIADRLPRLEAALIRAFGDAVKGETLTVRQYSFYVNSATIGRETASVAAASVAGGSVTMGARPTPACPHEKMAHGWFNPADLTNSKSPVVVEIDVDLKGKTYKTQAAYSPPQVWASPGYYAPKGSAHAAVAQAAMAKANNRLITMIKANGLSAAPAKP